MENEHTQNLTPEALEAPKAPESTFDGTTLQLIGWRLLGILLSAVTLGIGAPWAQCMVYRWETKHTRVQGKRLRFDGTGLQLLGNYLLWGLLIVITLGIYAIFVPVRMHKWRAKHTVFDENTAPPAPTSGWAIVAAVLAGVLVLVLVGGGLCLFLMEHPVQENPLDFLPSFQSGKEEEKPTFPQGSVIIQDGDHIIVWQEQETVPPTQPTYPEGIRPPDPNDDGDYWYVDWPDGMNVRSGPDASYELLRRLPHGAEVEVLDWENGWAFLGDGWIAGNYLQVNRPRDAVVPKENIVGTWAFLREDTRWDMEAYLAVMFRFYADGTFCCETAEVYYENIGGSWLWTPAGMVENTALRGTYTYDGEDLHLEYLEEDDNDFDVWKRLDIEARWDGQKMNLEDHERIPTMGKDSPNGDGKAYPVLLPLDDDVDIYFDLPGIVGRYIRS